VAVSSRFVADQDLAATDGRLVSPAEWLTAHPVECISPSPPNLRNLRRCRPPPRRRASPLRPVKPRFSTSPEGIAGALAGSADTRAARFGTTRFAPPTPGLDGGGCAHKDIPPRGRPVGHSHGTVRASPHASPEQPVLAGRLRRCQEPTRRLLATVASLALQWARGLSAPEVGSSANIAERGSRRFNGANMLFRVSLASTT